ncbi:MAG: saccharopine dehydrogenase NADP-binding domain-containing protein [Rhodospirillaceae bacterium]|nr:saccharopine dehydrogenase NADP-binding domain-containing protein [Rhodospirillaceae bacterium]
MPERFPILVLGGYGVFGSRICRRLARDPGIRLIIAGRSAARAESMADAVYAETPDAEAMGIAIDMNENLGAVLDAQRPKLLIHTVGPYQGQHYRVVEQCIERGIHYLDLADDRTFVAKFDRLNAAAKKQKTLAVTGVSTLPGLSSAVVESLRPKFARMRELSIGITPGNRTPRGLAVVAAILSYAGKPMPRWTAGRWSYTHGWQDMQQRSIQGPTIGALGLRWFAACDVPDQALFPGRYPELERVTFHAGLELWLLHFGLWGFSWSVRLGLVRKLDAAAPFFKQVADRLEPFGTDRGGMFVEITGEDVDGNPLTKSWQLIAGAGDGPWIPCIPAVILARKLAHDEIKTRGAMPCCNMITLAEFADAVSDLDIAFETV